MLQQFEFLKRKYQIVIGCFCLVLGTSLSFTACLTNVGVTTTTSVSAAPTNTIGNLPAGDSSANSIITLNNALRSNTDQTSTLDLITQNGQVGDNCHTVNDCKCVFKWTDATNALHRVEQQPSYVEANLMRCLFTVVSVGVQYFDVSILINAASIESNSFRVYLTASNPSLNPSISTNYLQAQRYMCRDIMTPASNPKAYTNFYINKTLLDPRLWDIGQFYNLYTTSFGADYGAVAVQQGQTLVQPKGFECPPNPNDPSFDDNLDATLYSVLPLDLTNPSNLNIVNTGGGDNTIFPSSDNLNNVTNGTSNCPTGNEATCEQFTANRHDFYLATFQAGVFTQPFCTTHQAANFFSPSLQCTVDTTKGTPVLGSPALAGGLDIIGFGAVPDSSENCPAANAIQIPKNRKWAKVWRFRLSIQARTIEDVTNPNDIGELFCTNRQKECGTVAAGSPPNSVCFDAKSTTGPTLFGQPSTLGNGNCSTTGMAGDSSVNTGWKFGGNGTGKCSGGGTTPQCCLDNGNNLAGNGNPANFTPGGDYCDPSLHGANNAEKTGGNDNWLMSGGGNKKACIEDDTDANGKIIANTFPDARGTYQLGSRALEDNSKDDVVYVVTPPNITLATMQDPTSNVAKQYTPMRTVVKNGTKFPYSLDAGSSNTDQSQQRASIFPLCVLQDSQGGS